jgi:hypothetical protein
MNYTEALAGPRRRERGKGGLEGEQKAAGAAAALECRGGGRWRGVQVAARSAREGSSPYR